VKATFKRLLSQTIQTLRQRQRCLAGIGRDMSQHGGRQLAFL